MLARQVGSKTETFVYLAKHSSIQVVTSLEPMELLDRLKAIEMELGRQKTVENGPRSIDLDILIYGHENIESERLVVPHKKIFEREFVLRPLCE